MSEHTAVLFANEAFYVAFAARDFEAMDDLCAREAPVACVHPGWQPLDGREDVMNSWHGILTNTDLPSIRCQGARAYVYGETAQVICYESLGFNWLVASNLFVREGGNWKIVQHQAAPVSAPPEDDEDDDEPAPRMQ